MPASLVKELRGGSGFGAASSGYVVRPLCARPSMDDCLWFHWGRGRWMTVSVGIGSVASVPETMRGTARVACIVPSASCIDGVI